MNELKKWATSNKWPNWELVMYYCSVTVDESIELMFYLDEPYLSKVKRGIEWYTGKKMTTGKAK